MALATCADLTEELDSILEEESSSQQPIRSLFLLLVQAILSKVSELGNL